MKKFTIYNLQFSQGFTLIEMLTAISILGIIGAITVSVITITLRTTKKADLIDIARQDSDNALTQIVKNARYAQSMDFNNSNSCVPTATANTFSVIAAYTQVQTTYTCTAGTIQSNGVSLFNSNALKVSTCSFVCTQPTLIDPPTITIQYTLSPPVSGLFSETNFSMPFQTSVTLRNLSQ